jgi:fructokinase
MRIGVDLGGTKIEIALLEADGTISLRRREWAPSGDYQATVRAIAKLVDEIMETPEPVVARVRDAINGH